MAEGDGLLNRYTESNPYPGFESPPLRFFDHVTDDRRPWLLGLVLTDCRDRDPSLSDVTDEENG